MNKKEICTRLEAKLDTLLTQMERLSDFMHILIEQSGKETDFDLHTCEECDNKWWDGVNDDETWSTRYKCTKKNKFVKGSDEACRHFESKDRD